jgi:hypothetical protein
MNSNDLKRLLLQYGTKIPGWHTRRKIVVIESDDWGSIRMPSYEIYEKLLNSGIQVYKNPYQKYDSLESKDDLIALFDLLRRFRDKNGNHPVITANTITSNPDFDKIRASGFKEYHSELFTATLQRYSGKEKTFELFKQGLCDKIFFPQFHGREHLNVPRWMRALQSGDRNIRRAFDYKMFDLSTSDTKMGIYSFMDSLRYENEVEYYFILQSITEGLIQFEKLFGYKSLSFTAPRYTWTPKIELHLEKLGIKFLQGRAYQSIPKGHDVNSFKNVINYTGKKNKYQQIYLTRNVFFEPSFSSEVDWVGKALKEIRIAFFWKKPAVICTHRLNYIGSIFEENRNKNLQKLKLLLNTVLKKYPEVEFMTSVHLGDQIKK